MCAVVEQTRKSAPSSIAAGKCAEKVVDQPSVLKCRCAVPRNEMQTEEPSREEGESTCACTPEFAHLKCSKQTCKKAPAEHRSEHQTTN